MRPWLAAALLAGCSVPPPHASFVLDRFGVVAVGPPAATVAAFPAFDLAQAARAEETLGAGGVVGQVVGDVEGQELALVDALVSTSDGRSARTNGQGRFRLPGDPPADGWYVAYREGYTASALAAPTGEPSFRLAPLAIRRPDAPLPLRLTGKLLAPDGGPAAGALVTLADPHGAYAPPARSAADGSYALTVLAPARTVADGTLLVVGGAQDPWLGARGGLAAGAGHTTLPDVSVVRAAHPFRPSVPGAAVRLQLALGEARLELPATDGVFLTAPVPGARYVLSAVAEDAERGLRREVYRDDVDVSQDGLAATLLPAPEPHRPAGLGLNAALEWGSVAGASGYLVELAGPPDLTFLWEGRTAATGLPLSFQGELPAGRYALGFTALETGPGKDFRRSRRQLLLERLP